MNPIVNVENAKKVEWSDAGEETSETQDEQAGTSVTDTIQETPPGRPKRNTAGQHSRDKEGIWVSQIQSGGECNAPTSDMVN